MLRGESNRPLEVLRDLVLAHVLGQVPDPQVPRLAHHSAVAARQARRAVPPDSSHSHRGDGREGERRRHRRGGGVGGHHCCWINHSRRFHCAEKRFTFTYRGLPSLLVRLFVRSSAPSALDSCTSSLFCVSRSTDLHIIEGREYPNEIVGKLSIFQCSKKDNSNLNP